jgi:hypothetical protein
MQSVLITTKVVSLNPAHDRHDITVTLSKVALNTMTLNLTTIKKKKKKKNTYSRTIYLFENNSKYYVEIDRTL